MARKFQMEIVAAMAHTQSLSLLPRTNHSAPYVELRHSLPSRVGVVSPFVDQLMRFILNFRMADGSEIDIEMALLEALANAVIHGNGDNSGKREGFKQGHLDVDFTSIRHSKVQNEVHELIDEWGDDSDSAWERLAQLNVRR